MPGPHELQTPSLEHKRAAMAWAYVSPMEQQPELRKKYYSLIRGFPSLVQSVGIAQALAFLMSKARDERAHQSLINHLTSWLFDAQSPVPWTTRTEAYQGDEGSRLMRRLLGEADPEVWWYAEEEAIAFSIWLKRFAEAITPARERQGG